MLKWRKKEIPLISHDNIDPQNSQQIKASFNNYRNGVVIRNLKECLNSHE